MATSGTVIAYQAVNGETGDCYVGVTASGLRRRSRDHLTEAARGGGYRFHRAIRKYGADAFEFTVIAEFGDDYELALAYEFEEVAKSRPAYNIAAGGVGGQLGRTHSDAAKEKMRSAKIGKPNLKARGMKRSLEARLKMSVALKGHPASNRGKPMSAESRAKLSMALTGKRAPPETPLMRQTRAANMRRVAAARMRPVVCLTDGKVYPSAHHAAVHYGLTKHAVRNCIRRGNPCRVMLLKFAWANP